MKIFTAQEIRQADEITVLRQDITSLDLMDRAANEVFLWIKYKFPDKETVFHIFCGQGNNGGDGLVVARQLNEAGYLVILEVFETGKPGSDFTVNLNKIKDAGLAYNTGESYNFKKGKLVVIDALFGIGLSRELSQDIKDVISRINSLKAIVVSIDVPSGLFLDRPTNFAVNSDIVLTFQFPKLAFYLSANCNFTKDIVILDIGLDTDYINATKSNYYFTDAFDAHTRYKPLHPHAHKGTQGHALIIGMSYGKIGAVCLSAKAALKSGSGLVTAYIPECGYVSLQSSLPEAMVLTSGKNNIENINFEFKPSAIAIGMGLGQEQDIQNALGNFFKLYNAPMVIDADALNILSYNKEWLKLLPENTILTPHPKELERLIGKWDDDFDKLDKIKYFSKQYRLIIVAKDSTTMIISNDDVYINSTGNAGLATGGSGDVLAGIIAGLLSQSYNPVDAAIFGVYLHGLSADIGVKEISRQAFIASDIIHYIGAAYLKIEKEIHQK